jgi:sugar/nucleoside kinase (ribokinase family)
MPFEVLTMGRVGVDVYPLQLTKTGANPFGDFVRTALEGYGVDSRFVGTSDIAPTPVTFCEIFPPDDFPLYFYRLPKAPDLDIRPEELDLAAVRCAWIYYAEALRHTTVGVGNLDECEVATGELEPHAAAKALLAAGVELAVVKQGPKGVLAMDRDGSAVEVPPVPVAVINGLGAGDAFGGALCHGLLSGWDTGAWCPSPTPPARSWPAAWPARRRCPPRPT